RAALLLFDHVGVALGGAGEESSRVVRQGLARLGGRGEATVLGTSERLPPAEAAIANGAAAHALEMDDTHQGRSLHLGAAGFHAPASILEGRFGVLHAYSDAPRPERLRAGARLAVLETSLKPHACCRYMQGPIDAALALRAEHRLAPEAISRIEVGMLGVA